MQGFAARRLLYFAENNRGSMQLAAGSTRGNPQFAYFFYRGCLTYQGATMRLSTSLDESAGDAVLLFICERFY